MKASPASRATIHIVNRDYATTSKPNPHTDWVVDAESTDGCMAIPTLAKFCPGIVPEIIDRRKSS